MMKHFKLSEFECPCCGGCVMQEDFLMRLDRARDIAMVPFSINSGYRCQAHNRAVGGVPTSSHTRGCAVDIHVYNDALRGSIIRALILVGFNRIGIGKGFVHVDSDENKNPLRIWLY